MGNATHIGDVSYAYEYDKQYLSKHRLQEKVNILCVRKRGKDKKKTFV